MSIAGSSTQSGSTAAGAGHPPPAVVEEVPWIDLYLVRTGKPRPVLFLTRRALDACAAQNGDSIRRFIRRLLTSRNRFIHWIGRATRTGHRFYLKLEDQIDPQERMVKALNCRRSFRVWHAAGSDPDFLFRDFLKAQAFKHSLWLVVDGLATLLALLLMPIPGPNVLGWYPFLRSVSHYRALKGIRRAWKRRSEEMRFRESSGLTALELNVSGGSQPGPSTERLDIEGLEQFLARVG